MNARPDRAGGMRREGPGVTGWLEPLAGFVRTHRAPITGLLFGVLLPLVLFGEIAEDVFVLSGFKADRDVLLWIHALASPARDRAVVLVTNLGGAKVMSGLGALALAAFVFYRRGAAATFFALAVGGAMVVNLLAKLAFQRPRPDLWPKIVFEPDSSFPSGHATATMAVVTALAVIAWPTRWRWVALVLGGAFVVAVGLSRLYLGVHYPSDVLGGWAASLAWVIGLNLVISGRARKPRTDTIGA